MSRPRYFAWTRVFTGKPVSRAYVMDRLTGKVVVGCPHRHRQHQYALQCADKLLAKFLKERENGDERTS